MNTETMVSVRIPFSGFYNSLWDDIQNRDLEGTIEYGPEAIYPEKATDAECIAWGEICVDKAQYGEGREEIARKYAASFVQLLEEKTGKKSIAFEYEELASPKFYNFETDKIFIKLPLSVLLAVMELPEVRDNLDAQLIRHHKSRSGFHSFYSHEMGKGQWAQGPEEWDYNQWHTILDCLTLDDDAWRDFEMETYEWLTGNGSYIDGIPDFQEWLTEYRKEQKEANTLDGEELAKVEAAILETIKPDAPPFVVSDMLASVTRETELLEVSYLYSKSGQQEKIELAGIVGGAE